MISFGTPGNHARNIEKPGNATLTGWSSYSVALVLRPLADFTTLRLIVDLLDDSANEGWALRGKATSGNNRVSIVHGDGTLSTASSGKNLTNGVDYHLLVEYDGEAQEITLYWDGVADSLLNATSFTRAIDSNVEPVTIGGRHDLTLGEQFAFGQLMIWPERLLTSDERTELFAGLTVPAFDDLALWHKGTELAGADEITGEAFEANFASSFPTLLSVDAVDGMFAADIERGVSVRESVSRDLRHRRTRFGQWSISASGPASGKLLDAIVMADAYTESPQGPHDTGLGWVGADRRRLGRCIQRTYTPGEKRRVKLSYRDLSLYGAWFWDTGRAAATVRSSIVGGVQGPARLDPGITRTASRLSSVFVPEIGGRVAGITANLAAITPFGTLVQPERKNYVKDSSFKVSSTVSWATITDAGSVNATDEGVELLYDPKTTSITRAKRITTTTAGNNGYRQATTYSVDAADYRVFSCDLKRIAGTSIAFRVRRDSDSKYWDGAAWQASETEFTIVAGAANELGFETYETALDYTDQSPTAQTHRIDILTTSANADTVIGHVQLENADDGLFATSRIPTEDAGAATRRADVIKHSNDAGSRIIPNTRGGLSLTFRPLFNEANLSDLFAAYVRTILWIHYADDPSGNWFRFVYADDNDGSGAYYGFESYRAGTESRAKFYVDVDRGTEYRLRARWLQANEQGITDPSMRLYVTYPGQTESPVGEVVEVAAGFAVESTPSLCYYGPEENASGEQVAAGYISDVDVTPPVVALLSDGLMLQR